MTRNLEESSAYLTELYHELSIKPKNIINQEEIDRSTNSSIKKSKTAIQSSIAKHADFLDRLRFDEKQRRSECEQLEEQWRQLDAKRLNDLHAEVKQMEQRERETERLENHCKLLDDLLDCKFLTGDQPSTMCTRTDTVIFNPTGVIEHPVPMATNTKGPLTERQSHNTNDRDAMISLWNKLELPDNAKGLLQGPPGWKVLPSSKGS